MKVIANLIEIARERTRLSQQMILESDVFEKDEIAQSMHSLAGKFILKRREFRLLKVSDEENSVLRDQMKLHPIIMSKLEEVSDLALEDTQSANNKATYLLVKEVVPTQGLLIDGFMQLLLINEEAVRIASKQMHKKHQIHYQTRTLLYLSILIISVLVILLVIKNVLKVENRLYNLSRIDALTGVLNRRSFDEAIEQEWKRALRTGKPLSLLLIDIDHFKKYNDHYGHQEGDDCLIKVANVLKSTGHRPDDVIARYGGEEFAIILPNANNVGASTVADRLLDQVRLENIPHKGSDTEHCVTISIGQTSVIPTLNNSFEGLIKDADLALYQSKKSGRNQVSRL